MVGIDIGSKSVKIVELEKERIVYGFVNQNTVIITTDRGTFAALAEAIH